MATLLSDGTWVDLQGGDPFPTHQCNAFCNEGEDVHAFLTAHPEPPPDWIFGVGVECGGRLVQTLEAKEAPEAPPHPDHPDWPRWLVIMKVL